MCVCVCVCVCEHVCPGASALTQTLGGPVASALLRAACPAPGADLAQLSEGMWCFLPTLSSGSGPAGGPAGLHSTLLPLCHVCHAHVCARVCWCPCKGVSEYVCVCVWCVSLLTFFFSLPRGLTDGFTGRRFVLLSSPPRNLELPRRQGLHVTCPVPTGWHTAAALPLYPCSLQ